MNKKLPTIQIHGNEYVMVKDRLIAFQELYPKGEITTEIVKNDPESVIVRAKVSTGDNRMFTGHSEAFKDVSGVEGQSPLEVCETSAVGRALAMLGIGVIESVASADEIKKSSWRDEKTPWGKHADTMSAKPASEKQKEYIMSLALQKGVLITRQEIDTMDGWQAKQKIDQLKKMASKKQEQYEIEDETMADIALEREMDDVNAELAGMEKEE